VCGWWCRERRFFDHAGLASAFTISLDQSWVAKAPLRPAEPAWCAEIAAVRGNHGREMGPLRQGSPKTELPGGTPNCPVGERVQGVILIARQRDNQPAPRNPGTLGKELAPSSLATRP